MNALSITKRAHASEAKMDKSMKKETQNGEKGKKQPQKN